MATSARKRKTDEDEEATLPIPDGYQLIKDDELDFLRGRLEAAEDARKATEERWSKQSDTDSRMVQANYLGLQNGIGVLGTEYERITKLLKERDDAITRYQAEVRDRDAKLSAMERASEEARLAREKMVAEARSKEIELKQKELELNAKHAQLKELLVLLRPLVQGGANAAEFLIRDHFAARKAQSPDVPGAPGGLPPPGPLPGQTSPTPSGPPAGWRVSLDGVPEWSAFLLEQLPKLKPESWALLRALIASGLPVPGICPPGATIPAGMVAGQMLEDLGNDVMLEFIRLTSRAWVEQQPSQANGVASATN
jgi:hypothetical protein